jgi:hypothetical protein
MINYLIKKEGKGFKLSFSSFPLRRKFHILKFNGGPMKNSNQHPGVSGKDQDNHSWINQDKFKEQREILKKENLMGANQGKAYDATGDESNLYGRSGLEDQPLVESEQDWGEIVSEALSKSPEIDASGIVVRSSKNNILIEGVVDSMEMKRAVENIASNISGVGQIFNRLNLSDDESNQLH